ncbi:MAG TPA: MBOAT family protein [Ruminococcaceae bacterium]|nr:MBOAT family protein [Oscillospiraceae bacterium]
MIGYTTFSFFILYFGITWLVYSLVPQKAKWCILLAGSYVFYFISSKGHIIPIVAASLIVWGVGLALAKLDKTCKLKRKQAEKAEKKAIRAKYNKYKCAVLWVGVISTAALLLVFKYTNFFIDTANGLFRTSIENVKIVQPLGLSFFILQAISYMIDIYYGRIEAEKNPLRISLYLSFMLTVVEGPIARYGQLGTQFKNCRCATYEEVSKGFTRVLWGLFKKVVIADRAVILVSAVFDDPEKFNGIGILAGIVFYTLQLYCEFSGVMDVMCGLGNMFGLQVPENFARPFFAKSINEFWQRWHISLGTWLRDYIFYSISFSKGFKNLSAKAREKFNPYYANLIPTAVALFFVWFTNGFWHGSGWKYITYGLYYYVLMMLGLFLEPIFAKICKGLKINRKSKPYGLFQILRTVVIVNFGMLIFRADDLKIAASMFKGIFTRFSISQFLAGSNGFGLSKYDYAAIIVGFVLMVVVGLIQEKGIDIKDKIFKLPYPVKFVLLMVFLFAIIIFGAYGEGYGVVDLIYANF